VIFDGLIVAMDPLNRRCKKCGGKEGTKGGARKVGPGGGLSGRGDTGRGDRSRATRARIHPYRTDALLVDVGVGQKTP